MKLKKAVKMMAAFTAVAAGIGTAVYFIKDKLNQNDLSEDFDDDFDDDFEDFDDEEKNDSEDSRSYVNIHCSSEENSTSEDSFPAGEEPTDTEAVSEDESAPEESVSED